jgi:hypothetical protein
MYVVNNTIIFGKFIKKKDGRVLVRCYHGFNEIKDHWFDDVLFRDIKNPEYLLIGLRSDKGTTKVGITDAGEYGKVLIKLYDF